MSAAAASVPPAWSFRAAGEGRYSIGGALTLRTVAALRERGLRAFAAGSGAIELHLGAVERADSGALALLIDWLAWARAAGREMKFVSVPSALLALAKLSGVDELLQAQPAD